MQFASGTNGLQLCHIEGSAHICLPLLCHIIIDSVSIVFAAHIHTFDLFQYKSCGCILEENKYK